MSLRPRFVARGVYRQRRTMDASRVLPFAGLALILMPVLWARGAGGAVATAQAWLWLFGVWGGLIIAAFLLSRTLRRALRDGEPDDGKGPGEADR